MTTMQVKIHGRQFGLGPHNEPLVRDPVTNENLHLVRAADIDRAVVMTQAAYDALTPKVATTLYVIVG
jgi:hypothetical protein